MCTPNREDFIIFEIQISTYWYLLSHCSLGRVRRLIVSLWYLIILLMFFLRFFGQA